MVGKNEDENQVGCQSRRGGSGRLHTFPDRKRKGLGWLRDVPDFRDTTLSDICPKFYRERGEQKQLYSRAVKPFMLPPRNQLNDSRGGAFGACGSASEPEDRRNHK